MGGQTGSRYIYIYYIYTWNPDDLYFWRSTPQNKAEIPIKTRVIWVPGIIFIYIVFFACLFVWGLFCSIYMLIVHGQNQIPFFPEFRWFHFSRSSVDGIHMSSTLSVSRMLQLFLKGTLNWTPTVNCLVIQVHGMINHVLSFLQPNRLHWTVLPLRLSATMRAASRQTLDQYGTVMSAILGKLSGPSQSTN